MKNIQRIVRQVNQVYYFVYTATILSTLIGYYLTMNSETTPDPNSNFHVGLSSAIILYVMASIPAALALFHRNLKKLRAIEDDFTKFQKYTKAAQLRLGIVGIGLVISIIGHFVIYAGTSNMSMIFCAAVAAIALFFCKPSINRVASELDLDVEED